MRARASSYVPLFAKGFLEEQYFFPVPHVDSRLTEKGGPTFMDEKVSDLKGDHQLQQNIASARHQYQHGKPYPISIFA